MIPNPEDRAGKTLLEIFEEQCRQPVSYEELFVKTSSKTEDQAVYLSIDRDKLTGGLQLSINDKNGGYRIFGPKYCGQSVTLTTHVLDKRDADEIRFYLRRVKSP